MVMIMKANTYDAKVNRNLNVTGLDVPAQEPASTTEDGGWTPEEILGE